MNDWQAVLLEPAGAVLAQIGQFLINILLVVIILIIGWLISKLIKTVITKGLRAIKVDELSDRIEFDQMLQKGGISYSLSELVGVICYWVAILVTFMVAINAVGLTIAADLLNKVVLYVPNVIAALFILILGMFFATLLRNIVKTAASNAGISHVQLFSKLVEIIVIVFSIVIAMEQLNIAIQITQLTLAIILGSIGLGLALAFGLGCRDIAGRAVNDFIEKLKKK
ncbi:MAG: hypothetical protein ABIG31_02530 [Candidatus Omnitrophota bacterium]